jgi:hypothetical protein
MYCKHEQYRNVRKQAVNLLVLTNYIFPEVFQEGKEVMCLALRTRGKMGTKRLGKICFGGS